MNLSWFRMYSEAVDDEKLRLLAFEDRWHFVAILCLKAMGTLDSEAPFLERRVALKLGLQTPQLDEVKRRLIEVGLIDEKFQPTAWGRRQFKSDHDAADRKRNQRERDSHNDVTTASQDSHLMSPAQSRAEQSREESEVVTPRATTPKKPRTAPRTACRLPDDFELTQERRLVAEAETLPAERTFEKFRDYWRSVSGAKARKLDWDATWRNWCKTEADRGKPSNGEAKRWM